MSFGLSDSGLQLGLLQNTYKMRYFKNVEKLSSDFGKIFSFDEKDIDTIYNMYGLYMKDEENELVPVREDAYCYNKNSQEINALSGHTSTSAYGQRVDFFFEDGSKANLTDGSINGEAYIYWDGHNWKAIIVVSAELDCVYEEVTGEMKGFEDAEYADQTDWNKGERHLLTHFQGKTYVTFETSWQGAFNTIEETECETIAEYLDQETAY
ncbi:hypothetical protein [Chitinophaga sp. MM2321]|uniref:hypothetical protein n=1 Tax=Chitinophaga sp. MM2321 TaxID=3137178 RepID=UPI0032D5A912